MSRMIVAASEEAQALVMAHRPDLVAPTAPVAPTDATQQLAVIKPRAVQNWTRKVMRSLGARADYAGQRARCPGQGP